MLSEPAFRAFYTEAAAPLRRYVVRVMGSATNADDVVQESFLRLLRHPPANQDAQVLRAYIFRIASNVMTDRWRKQKHERVLSSLGETETHNPDNALPLDMQRTFQKLRPLDRQLMWLAYVEGADHREIATTLGLRERSIRVLLSRARKKLLDFLNVDNESIPADAITPRTATARKTGFLLAPGDDTAEIRL